MMRSSSGGNLRVQSRPARPALVCRIASKMTAEVPPRERLAARWPSRRAPRRTRTGRCAHPVPRRAPAPATCRPPCRGSRPGWSTVLVGRLVSRRRADRGRLRSDVSLARPKSRILACAALGDEDVGRLDVAVDDALGVRGVQRVGDLRWPARAARRSVAAGPAMRCFSVRPSSNSMAMKCRPSASSMSWMVQMFGWFSAEAARASRWKRSSACGSRGELFGQELQGDGGRAWCPRPCRRHPCPRRRAFR